MNPPEEGEEEECCDEEFVNFISNLTREELIDYLIDNLGDQVDPIVLRQSLTDEKVQEYKRLIHNVFLQNEIPPKEDQHKEEEDEDEIIFVGEIIKKNNSPRTPPSFKTDLPLNGETDLVPTQQLLNNASNLIYADLPNISESSPELNQLHPQEILIDDQVNNNTTNSTTPAEPPKEKAGAKRKPEDNLESSSSGLKIICQNSSTTSDTLEKSFHVQVDHFLGQCLTKEQSNGQELGQFDFSSGEQEDTLIYKEKLMIMAQCKWNHDLEGRWTQMEHDVQMFKKVFNENKAQMESQLQGHPFYSSEWAKFWGRRYSELLIQEKQTIDYADSYDFTPEWKVEWDLITQQVLSRKHDQIIHDILTKYGMDLATLQKLNRTAAPIQSSQISSQISTTQITHNQIAWVSPPMGQPQSIQNLWASPINQEIQMVPPPSQMTSPPALVRSLVSANDDIILTRYSSVNCDSLTLVGRQQKPRGLLPTLQTPPIRFKIGPKGNVTNHIRINLKQSSSFDRGATSPPNIHSHLLQ